MQTYKLLNVKMLDSVQLCPIQFSCGVEGLHTSVVLIKEPIPVVTLNNIIIGFLWTSNFLIQYK